MSDYSAKSNNISMQFQKIEGKEKVLKPSKRTQIYTYDQDLKGNTHLRSNAERLKAEEQYLHNSVQKFFQSRLFSIKCEGRKRAFLVDMHSFKKFTFFQKVSKGCISQVERSSTCSKNKRNKIHETGKQTQEWVNGKFQGDSCSSGQSDWSKTEFTRINIFRKRKLENTFCF